MEKINTYLSIYSIYLSTIYLSTYLSMYLSTYLSTCIYRLYTNNMYKHINEPDLP